MVFNNDISYNPLKRYGIYAGTYTLRNIQQTQPIAILNSGIEDKFTESLCMTLNEMDGKKN